MIVEAATLISIFSQVREWLGMLNARDVRDKADYKAALKSIYVAAFETKAYLASTDSRKSDTELKLSRLWSEAAVELRPINFDLADRCLIKADYWADPSKWSQSQIDDARIGLETIISEARKLL
jgi:hypothetical protein